MKALTEQDAFCHRDIYAMELRLYTMKLMMHLL